MVLGGKVNKSIVAGINQQGGRAVGLSGKDGALIEAEKMRIVHQPEGDKPPEIIDPGLVGEVKRINPDIINTLTEKGFIPVIAPVGTDKSGKTYNINADLVAPIIALCPGCHISNPFFNPFFFLTISIAFPFPPAFC